MPWRLGLAGRQLRELPLGLACLATLPKLQMAERHGSLNTRGLHWVGILQGRGPRGGGAAGNLAHEPKLRALKSPPPPRGLVFAIDANSEC